MDRADRRGRPRPACGRRHGCRSSARDRPGRRRRSRSAPPSSLEDPEPQDEQRHPGDRGDRAQRLQVGSRSWRARVEKPVSAPSAVASTSPSAKPAATRQSVAARCRASSPERHSSASVSATFEGGGSSRASIQPSRAASSQTTATTRAAAGRGRQGCRSKPRAAVGRLTPPALPRPRRLSSAVLTGAAGDLARRSSAAAGLSTVAATSTSALMISALCSACPAARIVWRSASPGCGSTNCGPLELLGRHGLGQLGGRRPAAWRARPGLASAHCRPRS